MKTDSFDSLASCVRHWKEQFGAPGVVVGIYRNGDVELHADGIGHLAADWPMRTDNLFRIDEGKLDLDEPVKTYLPDFKLADPAAEATVTTRHLLTHMGGFFGDYFDDFGSDDGALAREIDHLHTLRQITKPGEIWHYSNSGFDLAGYVIATIAGMDFESFIRERIFEPLEMQRAGFFAHEMIVWPHAVGHDPVEPLGQEHRVADQHYARNNNPSGAIFTNADELLRFAAMHMNDGVLDGRRLLSPESARAMREAQVDLGDMATQWGLGWNLRRFDSKSLVGHSGTTCGFQSQLTLSPEDNVAFVIWTNSYQGRLAINPIEKWILKQELGLEEPTPAPVQLPSAQLERLAGRYSTKTGEINVSAVDDALQLAMSMSYSEVEEPVEYPTTTFVPLNEELFVVLEGPFTGERIRFFDRGTDSPVFLRRHGRMFDRAD
jgi:CubicO group peptidase (beta-lactamase class C family)